MRKLIESLKLNINKIRDLSNSFYTKDLCHDIEEVLKNFQDKIPVFLISYNNAVYVQNSVVQLNRFDITPVVIDNNSTDESSKSILSELEKSGKAHVIFAKKNFGHMVGFLNPVFEILPEVFAYSDPDLMFNKKLPKDFLNILADLTKRYKVFKAGFALELIDEEMKDLKIKKECGFPRIYTKELGIKEWEERFWRMKLEHPQFDVYQADIDTTFAVYKKSNYLENFFDGVRVGGDFCAVHLPWYPKLELLSKEQKQIYLKSNKSSSWID